MSQPAPAPTRAAHDYDRGWRGLAVRLIWLLYLLLYPVPWIGAPPTQAGIAASAAGIGVFLAIYWHAVFRKPASVLPHVVGMAAIGFAVSPFGGAWSVLNVFAATTAARMVSRRMAVGTLAALIFALVAFGIGVHQMWIGWVSGVFFSLFAAGGTFLQADLERRNRQLLMAQDQVRVLSALSERERIGRDLHDLLGHTLTLIAVKAELAARLAHRDLAASHREMAQVATIAREALAEVRTAVTGMQGATLATEIDRACTMLSAAGVEAEVQADHAGADPSTEAVLAMALREAVTNVIRHAGARRCTIGVDNGRGGLRLSVADDGVGGPIAEGSGLSGMRARVSAAGGVLHVDSGTAGTRLVATLPRPPADAPSA